VNGSRHRLGATAVVTAVVGLLFVLSAAPAYADETVTLTPSTQTVEYGQFWSIQGQASGGYPSYYYGSLTVTSGTTSKNLGSNSNYNGGFSIYDQQLEPEITTGVGTHSFTALFSGGYILTTASAPAKVTVTPAVISSTTTIVPDPNNALNATVTAQLTGKFIDQLNGEGANGYVLPAGSWHLVVTGADGKTILDKAQQVTSPAEPYFVYYWPNIPPGESMTAVTTFTPTSAAAPNFTFSSQKFSYTSAASTESATTGPTKHPASSVSSQTGAPTWVYVVVLGTAIILAAVVIVLLILRRRKRGPKSDSAVREVAA
jgi:hypothetical protein